MIRNLPSLGLSGLSGLRAASYADDSERVFASQLLINYEPSYPSMPIDTFYPDH